MTLPSFNVGGLMSGLDTNSIISQLMQVERIPMVQLQNRRAFYTQKDAAWQALSSRIASLSGVLASVSGPWDSMVSVDSSAPDAVTATVAGTPTSGSLTFTVDQLATNHQVASTSFASADDVVGAGTFTITTASASFEFVTEADSTLADLASQISSSDAGVSANVVRMDDSQVKLVLSSATTGAAAAFTAEGTQADLTSTTVVQAGKNATLTIGEGAGALIVQRSSNTITDLIDGVSLTLTQTSGASVTIVMSPDIDGAVEKVSKLVDELNATVAHLKAVTAYDPGSGVAGVLQGDSAARGLLLGLRSQVSGVVGGLSGPYTFASSVGVSLQRDGTFILDETKLSNALTDDFEAVGRLFARTGSTVDTRMAYSTSTEDTVDGSYDVEITAAASAASVVGSTYVAPGSAESFTITSGLTDVDVTIDPGYDLADAVAAVSGALSAAGVSTLTAVESAGAISIVELRYGSAPSFTISANSFGLAGTHTGTDVAGTIGGEAATGAGRHLTATAGDPDGLRVVVTATAAEVSAAGGTLSLGAVTTATGMARRLEDYLDGVAELDGVIERARDRWKRSIDDADDRIAAFEDRLERRELALIRQYAALETSLNRLAGMSNALAFQLAGLNGAGQ